MTATAMLASRKHSWGHSILCCTELLCGQLLSLRLGHCRSCDYADTVLLGLFTSSHLSLYHRYTLSTEVSAGCVGTGCFCHR